jgi:hypothetical protein
VVALHFPGEPQHIAWVQDFGEKGLVEPHHLDTTRVVSHNRFEHEHASASGSTTGADELEFAADGDGTVPAHVNDALHARQVFVPVGQVPQ